MPNPTYSRQLEEGRIELAPEEDGLQLENGKAVHELAISFNVATAALAP